MRSTSNITVNKHLRSTGQALATVRVEVHLTAEEIAYLLAATAIDPELPQVPVTGGQLRHAVRQAVFDTIERGSYIVGDNDLGTQWETTKDSAEYAMKKASR
jgi:hypothetical protein